MLCVKAYNIRIQNLRFYLINSQAYSFASFIPGQIGIDAWRIGRLRKLDSTKYKIKLGIIR